MNEADRYQLLVRVLGRNGTVRSHAQQMLQPDAYDADLLDFIHWGGEIRGYSDATLRVRLDFVHRLYLFAGCPLREVDSGTILRFERVAIAGRAPESRRRYVCDLRAFYRWAKKRGIVEHDPTEVLTIPRVPRHLPRPIEDDELAKAMSFARPKMRAMLTLAAFAGLRAVEIAGMSWEDFRRDRTDSSLIVVRHAKGDRQRAVEVGEIVVKALQAYGVQRRGPMFLGQDGQQINARSVSASCNRFLARHDVNATLHQLRHRYASCAYQLTRDLRMVQELLGHASPQTTAGYTRPSAEAASKMVKAMDALGLPTAVALA